MSSNFFTAKRKEYSDVNRLRVATCYQVDGKPKTKSGLAYTPAQMNEMMQRGIPVTNKNLENKFFDGDTATHFNVDLMRERGVDIADVWQAEQEAKQRFKDARNKYLASKKQQLQVK